jgi:hypothetical protein
MENMVRVPQMCWEGVCDLELTFPKEWNIEVVNMAGYNQKALSAAEINKAISKPLGLPPIRELAAGKSWKSWLRPELKIRTSGLSARPAPTGQWTASIL